MAGKRRRNNGTWEYVFKRKGVLSEPKYFTFDTEQEGDAYAARAEALLDQGIVPPEMKEGGVKTLGDLIDLYGATVRMATSEKDLLPYIKNLVESVRIEQLTYAWVEGWVEGLQAAGKAPSTITKRVSGLARVVDWGMRRGLLALPANPLRLLPKGYSGAGLDRNELWAGERSRRLEEREIRLGEQVFQTEEGAIRSVLTDKNEALLFDMALETAMRLSEMFTLKVAQIDLGKRTIFLPKTKNGSQRQVPISSTLLALLKAHDMSQSEWLFPNWWQGDMKQFAKVSNKLSHLFSNRFKRAGCPDLHFHDLRHEATSRIYERTSLSDLEVASITGHKGFRMLQRYANLRGSTLATRLW